MICICIHYVTLYDTYYTYEYVIIFIYVSADDMNFLSQGLCWEIRALSLSGGMNHSKRLFSRIPETQQTEKASEFKAWRHMKPDWHALHVMLSVTFSANVDESMTPDQCGVSPSTIWELSGSTTSQFHRFISIQCSSRVHGVNKLCQVAGFFTNALLPEAIAQFWP